MTFNIGYLKPLISAIIFGLIIQLPAQHIPIGSGSYTTQFPGTDVAGRNGFPSGTPYTIGNAAGKPAPTNDWWSNKIKNAHSDNLFNYPFTMKTLNTGLITTYIPWGVIDDIQPVIVGVKDLNASACNVSDYTDWTVKLDWQNGTNHFTATAGIGMPFLYFEKAATDSAQVIVNQGNVTVNAELLIINNLRNNADFAVYAPLGSTWVKNGNRYTSSLNGKNYWSMAFIPLTSTNVSATANDYKKYAYVYPKNTSVNWSYDEATAKITTNFLVETEVKEGLDSNMLIGLLPHQWNNLAAGSAMPSGPVYATVRGDLKTMVGNSFQVVNTFYGILPTLPYLDFYSDGFNPGNLDDKVQAVRNNGLDLWTDSYNEGQLMNRLIQTARIAALSGDTASLNKMVQTVKNRLEDWLKSENGEIAFIFYYNQAWSSLLGYPAGHGQDNNINDHHFHWGYFIHAAAFLEQYQPGWAADWGPMINLLVRDAASDNRNDSLFPFLRNFSPYAGHCWANGFATFPQGNDQESTSESMQFNSSLIHWGSITGNKAIRDLGIYLYTTEQTAIEEYWFDKNKRNFKPSQNYGLVSRVWGNSYDNGTFWTNDIAASYGIEMYPIHGGSLYLGHDTNYVSSLWKEIERNTGILSNQENPNLWHDVKWEYLAFINPTKAIQLYNSYPDRSLKFGISDAQTYHWLHAMNVLGIVDVSVTSNHPLAAVFIKGTDKTYVAQNYSATPLVVNFSDGYILNVPARKLATSKDISIKSNLETDFSAAYPGGSFPLRLNVVGGSATKVEFFRDGILIGQTSTAPYQITAINVPAGNHRFYAKVYQGTNFALSNMVNVIVGEQLPFSGNPIAIPGNLEAGNYDIFEGGSGRGISYTDMDLENKGDFRKEEAVDAIIESSEGNTVGWIVAGEWLEYTVLVEKAGLYNLSIRYASGNTQGGGPMHIITDGDTIVTLASLSYTGDWDKWATSPSTVVPLKSGLQIIRLAFEEGEFNLGKLIFTYNNPLNYSQPIADAGENKLIQLPANSTVLDGIESTDPMNGILTYQWEQVFGPSVLAISNPNQQQTNVSGLIEGVYRMRLTVSNGAYSDQDEMYIISSTGDNVAPKISIISPFNDARFIAQDIFSIAASASDLNDSISKVEFYANNQLIGTDSTAPYAINWSAASGNYSLTAKAFDHLNLSSISAPVAIVVTPAPSCRDTSDNKEFVFEFSADKNNPTLTFIPTISGMGSPTCILYYGTSASNALPGYGVTPNVPFRLNAAEGATIYFYYTYSYPGQGERNNAANKNSYKIGSCREPVSAVELIDFESITYYPNPVDDILNITLPKGIKNIQVFNLNGQLMDNLEVSADDYQLNTKTYPSGLYMLNITMNGNSFWFKIVK